MPNVNITYKTNTKQKKSSIKVSNFDKLSTPQRTSLSDKELHSHTKGSVLNARKKLVDAGLLKWDAKNGKWIGDTINRNTNVSLKWLPLKDVIPIDGQRETKMPWVTARLLDRNGFDYAAFGALSVAKIPGSEQYGAWDGCGRHAIADLMEISSVPCLVYENMEKEKSAEYMTYTQGAGNRPLNVEVRWINSCLAGDIGTKELQDQFEFLGLYVKDQTKLYSPSPRNDLETPYEGSVESKLRTVVELNKSTYLASAGWPAHRLARDIITNAWGTNVSVLPQDLFWGLISLLREYPLLNNVKSRQHGILQGYLNSIANIHTPVKASKLWKYESTSNLSSKSPLAGKMILEAMHEYRKLHSIPLSFKGIESAQKNLNVGVINTVIERQYVMSLASR
jgi:hypothetical protein